MRILKKTAHEKTLEYYDWWWSEVHGLIKDDIQKVITQLWIFIIDRSAIFRSKVRWTEKEEKPTKYFLTLRKQDLRRRLSHNYKSERISLYQILNKLT